MTKVVTVDSLVPRGLPWDHACTLDVHAGEIVVILGPNGVGKTSLLEAVHGSATPTRGTARVDNVQTSALCGNVRRNALGWIPQKDSCPRGFTVRERIEISANSAADVAWALECFELKPLANQAIETLSGGEARRCAVAAAIAQRGRCLLADEPTGAMDPRWAAKTIDILTQQARDAEQGILAVIHDIPLAQRFADRIALIGPDGVRAVDHPKRVLDSDCFRKLYTNPVATS